MGCAGGSLRTTGKKKSDLTRGPEFLTPKKGEPGKKSTARCGVSNKKKKTQKKKRKRRPTNHTAKGTKKTRGGEQVHYLHAKGRNKKNKVHTRKPTRKGEPPKMQMRPSIHRKKKKQRWRRVGGHQSNNSKSKQNHWKSEKKKKNKGSQKVQIKKIQRDNKKTIAAWGAPPQKKKNVPVAEIKQTWGEEAKGEKNSEKKREENEIV